MWTAVNLDNVHKGVEMGEPEHKTLADLRRNARLSQAELAKKAGLSAATIGKVEIGTRVPGFRTLQALAKVLGKGVFDCDYGSDIIRSKRGRPTVTSNGGGETMP
jgi:transcriptional regulator with XRE-family HTH domain